MSKDKIKKSFKWSVKHVSLGILAALAYVGFDALVFSQTNDAIVYVLAIVVIASLLNNVLSK